VNLKQLLTCVALSLSLSAAALLAASWKIPFGAWHRVSQEPILSPEGSGWQSAGAFNPTVVIQGGRYIMLYRAQDQQRTSRLGYAESTDGGALHPPS
jgi:hypothetical protein